jgi:hypothetical protein
MTAYGGIGIYINFFHTPSIIDKFATHGMSAYMMGYLISIIIQICLFVLGVKLLIKSFGKAAKKVAEQAVMVYLDGTGLPVNVYEECDTSTLEDLLINVLEQTNLGEVDGSAIADTEAVIFLYGPDGEKLFARILPVLRSYPLCQGARVIIRYGATGALQREFKL